MAGRDGSGRKFWRIAGTVLIVGVSAYIAYRQAVSKSDEPSQVATERPAITSTYAPVSPTASAFEETNYTPSSTSAEVILPTGTPSLESRIDDELLLGSFNIQILGESKAGKPDVMDALGKIVSQYDLVAIQEIRDSSTINEIGACSGVAITSLLDRIRAEAGFDYGCIQGDRQGRTSSKEQYAFIFNPKVVQPLGDEFGGAYTFNDTNDLFEREPLIAQFRAGDFDFALANIHTKPDDARAEICALAKVVEDAEARYNNDDDVIVLGDFNADGSYFNENTTECLRGIGYNWAIGNSIDTTVAATDNTYDRIVFRNSFGDEDFSGPAGAFYFNLPQTETPFFQVELLPGLELKNVSDHYPIWAVFYTGNDTD